MKEITYNIVAGTAERLIKSMVDTKQLKNKENIDNVMSILSKSLSSHHVNALLEMILSNEVYVPFAIGDYIKVQPPSYHEGDKFEWDILLDNGLATKDGFVYGIITSDGSWSSEFDPYFQQMKVDLLYFDKVLAPYDYKMETFSLEKVSKEDIPHFNETEKPAQTDLFEMIEEETNQL